MLGVDLVVFWVVKHGIYHKINENRCNWFVPIRKFVCNCHLTEGRFEKDLRLPGRL